VVQSGAAIGTADMDALLYQVSVDGQERQSIECAEQDLHRLDAKV